MGESLYHGFDHRAHVFFEQLKQMVGRESPDKRLLRKLFVGEVRRALKLESREVNDLRASFNAAFRAHYKDTRRNGEAYILHVVRAAVIGAWIMELFGVKDVKSLYITLLHDSDEETRSKRYLQLFIRVLVRLGLGNSVATSVRHLTQNEDEDDDVYLLRLITEANWYDLFVKLIERGDNIWTLVETEPEKSKRKILDTEVSFPTVARRLEELVGVEVEEGRLSQDWLKVVTFTVGYLWYAVAKKKREFNAE